MYLRRLIQVYLTAILAFATVSSSLAPASAADLLRQLQADAFETKQAPWGHWGAKPEEFKHWDNHSNRLVPVYTFGVSMKSFVGQHSAYRSKTRLEQIYGELPAKTLNSEAEYLDQTDIYRLQLSALDDGKKYIFLLVFDGMDWQTTQAAAISKTQQHAYSQGRGTGLRFQDYDGVESEFGWMVTSAHSTETKIDVNQQTVQELGKDRGGYDAGIGGSTPWGKVKNDMYLLGKQEDLPHVVTDSAASATSMCAGVKTFNGAINIKPNGRYSYPLARRLQSDRYVGVGLVTNVPISHATPGAAYANNVSRNDYQDITRDLLGIPSISHPDLPLDGVDVLLGCGWGVEAEDEKKDKEDKNEKESEDDTGEKGNDGGAGEVKDEGTNIDDKEKKDAKKDEKKEKEEETEQDKQGENFVPGNKYLTDEDLHNINVKNGGRYSVAVRTPGRLGSEVLIRATNQAVRDGTRLFGFFGVTGEKGRKGGHLPYRTADGQYNPVEATYEQGDIYENPTLADMTSAAIKVLERNPKGFWLMVEAGDVDWANHSNNLDNSIGAVHSGEDAFEVVTDWIEDNDAWDESAVIVTADHGHYFVLRDPEALVAVSDEAEKISQVD